MSGEAMLDDHRRFGAATLVALVVLAVPVTVALLVGGRPASIPGVWTGVIVAAADVVLLARGVTRFGRFTDVAGAAHGADGAGGRPGVRGMTAGLLVRFVAVAGLLGIAMAARSLDPVAVVCGFLLLPMALVTVGWVAIRRAGDGGARRRHLAR